MFTLVWDKDRYAVEPSKVEMKKNSPSDIPQLNTRAPLPLDEQEIDSSKRWAGVEFEVWKEFVDKGKCQSHTMDWSIWDSWQRCRQRDVDPAPRKCWDIMDQKKLEPEMSRIKTLISGIKENLYSKIKGKGLLITVSNQAGYLVDTCGDYKTLLIADKLNFGPGANWSEQSVGTNAIGTSLATGRPLKVLGREHYCQSHHTWCCAAAPIFEPSGQIVGCLDISGPVENDHRNTLSLAAEAARQVENRLYQENVQELIYRSNSLMSVVFNSVLTGLISVDLSGTIRQTNPAANTLLGASDLVGQNAETFFNYRNTIKNYMGTPQQFREKGIFMQCRQDHNLLVQVSPLTSRQGRVTGAVLSIIQCQSVHPVSALKLPESKTQKIINLPGIIGQSTAIQKTMHLAARAAKTSSNVLLQGASGTGKEVFARAIHKASKRSKKPFIAVNCGAISRELIQSELFGYVDGAFTGARTGGRAGKFEQAHGGTLFLDEIGEMPLKMQVNLLRVLEDREVVRVGGNRPVKVDVRIIAATNRNLEQEVEDKNFRQDLYYRLRVVNLAIPDLKDRENDIELLAKHFIKKLSNQLEIKVDQIDSSFMECLKSYNWPGNVRELVNSIEYALNLMIENILQINHLPPEIHEKFLYNQDKSSLSSFKLCDVESNTIEKALNHFEGNISKVAKALGIGRNTLYSKIKKYNIDLK